MNTIKVLTLNIWGISEPYTERMRLVRDWIEREQPDLMAFQEAAKRGECHQIRDLLDGLAYHVCHQQDVGSDDSTKEGICIASRWPIAQPTVRSLSLSAASSGYPYAALAARIEAPEPFGDFLFVNNKPSWELNREAERERQAVVVADMIDELTDATALPTILAGDFDATPDSASIRFFRGLQSLSGRSTHFLDAWEQGGDGTAGHTWTHHNDYAAAIIKRIVRQQHHARRIDYVFLASPHTHRQCPAYIRNCRVVLNEASNGVWPSDHFGVCAEIALGEI